MSTNTPPNFSDPSPTDRWIAVARERWGDALPESTGPASTAERLLLLLHYGIDWGNGWLAGYRDSYWSGAKPGKFEDRVFAAAMMCPDLPTWWTRICADLGSGPGTAAQRLEALQLVRSPDGVQVMHLLRTTISDLLLFVRTVTDAMRASRRPVVDEPETSVGTATVAGGGL